MTFFILTSLLSCNKIIDNPKPISNNNRNNHKINKRDQNKVIGIWKIHGEENSTFQIYKDSIYYTDKGKKYKYKIVKDSFYIYYDGWIDKSKFKIIGNKLIFDGEIGKDTFERFK